MAVQEFGGKVLGRPIEVLIVDHQNKADIAAATAIAAAGAAELDILLAAERHAAVSTVARADIDLCFVKEFHGLQVVQGGRRGNL